VASRQRSRWLAVEPGEGGRVGLLFGLFFFLALGYVLGQAGGYALFVQRFGARDLPFAFLLIPVVGAILAIGNLRIAARVGLGRMLLVDVAGMVAVSLAVRLGVAGDGRAWLLFSLPVWDAGVNTLSNVVVWNTASRLFDVRQVRRLVPLVAAGRSLALVVGGGLVPAVVHGLGTRNLYVLQTAMFVVALVLLVGLVRVHQAVIHETAASRRVPEPPGDTDRRRFVWSIFVVVFVSMLAYVLVR